MIAEKGNAVERPFFNWETERRNRSPKNSKPYATRPTTQSEKANCALSPGEVKAGGSCRQGT